MSGFVCLALHAVTSTAAMEHEGLVIREHVSARALRLLPNTLGLSTTFEQVAGPVVLLVEESGGFGDVDPEKMSIYGDSWAWTRWYVDGFDVSDPLFDGAAGFHVPFAAIDRLALRFAEDPMNPRRQGVSLDTRAVTSAGAALRIGEVGGRFFWAVPLMDAFSGSHASERVRPPPDARRRFGPSYELFLTERVRTGGGTLAIGAQLERSERRWLDFSWDGALLGVDPESSTLGSMILRHRPDHGRWEALVLGEVLVRDTLFADVGFQPHEASRFTKIAALAGIAFDGGRVALSAGSYAIEAKDRVFTRDIVDPEGQAMFPFVPDGHTLTVKADGAFERGPFYVWLDDRALLWSPARDTWSQPLELRGDPYGTWDFSTRDTVTLLGDHRAGVRGTAREGPIELGYDLFGSAIYATNRSGANALGFVDFGLRARASLLAWGPVRPFVAIAKTPMPITVAAARALDPAYLDASLTLLDGRTVDDAGGGFVSLARDVDGPNVYRAAIGLDVRVSDRFRFGAQGMFKLYRGVLRLDYDGPVERYGDFEGEAFFTNTTRKRYVLTNANDDLPVYFALHLDATTTGFDDFFFSASFSAYNAIGETPFGNGALANDLAVVDASTANPNARRLGLAALDLDRAFVFKLAVAYQPLDGLWLSATVRHRDGQPFAFLDPSTSADGRAALTYHSNRGSPFQYQRPLAGPREDFHLGADVQVAYRFVLADQDVTVWLLAANLFDMENEIAEVNGPAGVDGRSALESQLPRSVLLGFALGTPP